jgi:hypothetical protein
MLKYAPEVEANQEKAMTFEPPEPIPMVSQLMATQQPAVLDGEAPGEALPPLSEDEVRAIEAVFAREQREATQVAGLMGLWMGSLLLGDILKDTLIQPAGQIEAEKEKKKSKP